MKWEAAISEYKTYLKLERGLSGNSVEAYLHDVNHLWQFVEMNYDKLMPDKVGLDELRDFVQWVNELGMKATTQARTLSGIKSFYKFLLLSEFISDDPTELLDSPKIGRKLPDTLNDDEIEKIIAAIDLSKPEGERNKAIIEVLYACGLRVSELINLKISNLYFKDDFIKVRGKGNKERLVPIGRSAVSS